MLNLRNLNNKITFAQPQQQPQQRQPVQSAPPVQQRPLLTNQSPVNLGRVQVNNPIARLPAGPKPSFTPVDLVHQVTRAVPNLATIVTNKGYHPGSTVEKAIFGNDNVQPYYERRRGIQSDLQKKGGILGHLATPLSIAGTAANIVGDATAVLPAAKAVSAGAKASVKLASAETKIGKVAKVTDLKPAGVKDYKTANVRDIKPGDYAGARLAPQQLTYPTKVVAGRFGYAMDKLQKKDPVAWSNFWRHVEKPPTNPSKELNNAMYWWREGANRIHAHANAYGKQTSYLKDFALHPWALKDLPEETIARGGTSVLQAHSIARKYPTIAAGEARGLTLGTNPTAEGLSYLKGGANSVGRLVAKDALTKADAGELTKPHTLDLGWGSTVQLSDKGMKQAKALGNYAPSTNKVIRGVRTGNVAAKSSILSYGQFHPFNIAALRAGPALAFKGHPIAGARGVARTFRPLLPGGKGFVNKVITKAYSDGMIDKAAELGMPYGEAGYNTAGTSLKAGAGHELVFERQMPMMHDQVVRSIVKDLEKQNIPLASEAGRQAGVVGNATMGFINKEALNLSPQLRQKMSDWMLAGQFTPSKVVTLSKVAKKGTAGKYARADVASNALSAFALVAGLSYLAGQKSDSIRDLLMRALVDPAIPTPFKDKRGNSVEVGIPATYTGEISKLIGLTLERGADGHLHPTFNPPQDIPKNFADWSKARLSPFAGDALKVVTGTDYANKPLYDPNAPLGTKAAQAGTVIGQGFLPIGAQGLPYTDVVKKHVPGSVRDVLNANTPGSNPVLKSGASSIGFRPRTDQSVGKSLETSHYFKAKDEVRKGLKTNQDRAAFDLYTGSKKNPVTGKYDVKPTVWDTISRAATLNQNPEALNALISMNQKIVKAGGKADPLFKESPAHIQAYFENQANLDPFSAQRSVWYDKNKSWYQPLADARSKFFDSLPPGDPNRPAKPIEYPTPPKAVQSLKDQYYAITDSSKAFAFSKAHPELQNQFDKEFQYKNDLLTARGQTPYKAYPKAQPKVQGWIDKYIAADKGTRKGLRNSDPKMYQSMAAYFDSVDLYNINKEGAKNQLQGQPDQTNKQNKAIKNLAKDIYQQANGSYHIAPAGWMQGGSGGSGSTRSGTSGGSSNYGGSSRRVKTEAEQIAAAAKRVGSSRRFKIGLKVGKIVKPTVKANVRSIGKVSAKKFAKPKVSIKKSKI